MNRVLLVAEHDGTHLSPVTAKGVSCATTIPDSEVTVAVFGVDTAIIAEEAARLFGVTRVLRLDSTSFEHPMAAMLAPDIVALAAGYSHLLAPSTTFGKDLMPRVAALLGVSQLSDVMAVEHAFRFKRPFYAGGAIATIEVPSGQKVVMTVRSASYSAAASTGMAIVEQITAIAYHVTHTRFVSAASNNANRPNLQSASRVIAGGRGLGSPENFKLLYNLADKIGAAVGASRAAVDAGFASNDLQIGQTGKIIAPELYVAIGISGAIQHLTGIKDARTIVAINRDPDAPIFEVADFGLVGDLFQIVSDLAFLLTKQAQPHD